MTSSMKPEVCNIARPPVEDRVVARAQVTCTEHHFVKIRRSFRDMLVDRHTDTFTTVLRDPDIRVRLVGN